MDENKEQTGAASSSQPMAESETKDLATLTDQNWLFINAFLQTGNVQKSYKIAGYAGKDRSAPYQLFKQLKSRIEDLGNLDVTSRARLQADLKSVLDLPLAASKKELTLSEWLRVRKFTASLTPEATGQKPQISVLVINRTPRGDSQPGEVAKHNQSTPDPGAKDVIDAEIIP